MKHYLINSKKDLYNLGLTSQLGSIIIQGRDETVFDAKEHVVNTIQRIDSENVKLRKYTFEGMKKLDDFLEMDLSMQHPMFQRLRDKIFFINPEF